MVNVDYQWVVSVDEDKVKMRENQAVAEMTVLIPVSLLRVTAVAGNLDMYYYRTAQ